MDSRQAQVLSLLVYNIQKTVSLGHRMYMFDIGSNSKGHMCISASNNSHSDSYPSRKHESDIFFTSPSGLYIALKEEEEKCMRRELNCVYGTHNSVKQQQAVPLAITYWRGDTPQRNQKERLQLGESRILWGEDEDPLHRGCGSRFGFTPQGIAVTKSGGILICLWNNEFGERSSGKVISIDGKIQIFIDKDRPLYVCPTYIVENGNGDICVSDVRAVVVTDAGGMLRFRYQGNSCSNTFYPYGICCDSSCNIIVADMNNAKIHVVDKDGEFLYHVTYDVIKMPRALCIDGNDRVYVGEWDSDAIKVIAR